MSEVKDVLEKTVIGLEKRKNGLEKEYGFKPLTLSKKDRQRYYDYYNGKLFAYLWVLGAMGSKDGNEISNRLIKDIIKINNKCLIIEND